MIDLSRNQKSDIRNQKAAEPEEILCGILAVAIWTAIIFGIMAGL